MTQIAASFVLLAGAGMLLTALVALQSAPTGFKTHNVLALNVPLVSYTRPPEQTAAFYNEALRRISELPGVERVAVGTIVPWRDAGTFGPGFQFSVEGYAKANGEEDPAGAVSHGLAGILRCARRADHRRTRFHRRRSPRRRAGRHHQPEPGAADVPDPRRAEPPPDVDRSGDEVHRRQAPTPRRIIGIAADVDDENVVPGPALSVYHPFEQEIGGGRLFVHASADPYALVPPITRIIRELSPEQPVEQAATLDDVRAEVLAPDRLNALVFGGFAAVALTIAVVGVAGVLAFSVSARTREFGIRLAIGSAPRHLLTRVLQEGAVIAGAGIVAGVVGGLLLARVVGSYIPDVRIPGALPIVGAAVVLVAAAILASLMPAARASRVDVIKALRAD